VRACVERAENLLRSQPAVWGLDHHVEVPLLNYGLDHTATLDKLHLCLEAGQMAEAFQHREGRHIGTHVLLL
jgi:hypothetical protein